MTKGLVGLFVFVVSSGVSFARIKHTKIQTVTVYGVCGQCKGNIEKAGTVRGVARVQWNEGSKTATLTYDSTKTTQEEILKRIALAGYDNDSFLAPNDIYAKLPTCCRYTRVSQSTVKISLPAAPQHEHDTHEQMNSSVGEAHLQAPFTAILDRYFSVKDALVQSDENHAAEQATRLVSIIEGVDIHTLSADEHNIWKNVSKELTASAKAISKAKNINKQRTAFITLSQNVYTLAKATKPQAPVYYQRCPMYNNGKGAHWLSRENAVKNPYYGSQMLSCGSTVGTIQ